MLDTHDFMKVSMSKLVLRAVSKFANFQFLISNFQSISNVLMLKFLKRVVVAFRNSDIKNYLEIRNLKLVILGVSKDERVSGMEFNSGSSLI